MSERRMVALLLIGAMLGLASILGTTSLVLYATDNFLKIEISKGDK